VVEQLCQKYDVYIVSAATEFPLIRWRISCIGWAISFPFISWTNIIFCGYKIVNVDIMIDDRIRNFTGFNGRPLLFSSPHNLKLTEYERVSTWEEVAGKLL
jgi:5'(3')-deoxyribonucleotidase